MWSKVRPYGFPSIHFHCAMGFIHPNTRIDVRLLGPCFKTGRLATITPASLKNRSPRDEMEVVGQRL